YGFPKTRFVADFIGTCNLLIGPVTDRGSSSLTIAVPDLGPVKVATDASAARSDAAIALRPEKVRLSAPGGHASADNHYSGTVASLLYHGDVAVYGSRGDQGHEIEALLANSASGLAGFFEVGDRVEMSWPADAGHFVEE